MKTTTNIIYSAFALFALACFALLPRAQAVMPPPDGNYPGGNTAEGFTALQSLTTGAWNTALGHQTLYHDTTGTANTATGFLALFSNTEGRNNTATGAHALQNNEASDNTAYGFQTLFSNSSGHDNNAVGSRALFKNTLGEGNTAIGNGALRSNILGSESTAVGFLALAKATSIGRISNGCDTAVGSQALLNVTTGSCNIGLGFQAGMNLTNGDNNIDIGAGQGGLPGDSGTIRIGNSNFQTRTFIAGIRGKTTGFTNALPVLIDSAGQLGTASSSRRFKNEIKPMDKASESILALKPVTFHYKSDNTSTPQFGLIAEEVAAVNPDLVVCDENGKIYTVRYDAVNAMLLNEFLKEHGKVQELEANAVRQQKQIEALTAGLQKVSAQLELSKAAPQTVLNNQ
jgi:hypothetical protein